jgi:hypothetical protein
MAQFPCDVDDRRYVGPQRTMYPALVNGLEAYRRKLRCCPVHFDLLHNRLLAVTLPAQTTLEDDREPLCVTCREPAHDARWAFFVTVYDVRSEREDFWAPVHDACAAAVTEDWNLPT